MKACAFWKDPLLDHVLDEIDAQRAADLKRHVEGCVDCARALDALRSRRLDMDEGLRGLGRVAGPSPGFRGRLTERIESSPHGWSWRFAWVVVPAALVLVALASALVLRRAGRDSFEMPKAKWVAARELVEWRSPTEALLRSSVEELLRFTPRLSATDVFSPNPPGGNQ